jgi:hypothetical protein
MCFLLVVVSMFCDAILLIVAQRSNKQMLWIKALSIVATVANNPCVCNAEVEP